MTKPNADSSKGDRTEKPTVKIEIDAAPKGKWKALGGSDRDQWNDRLLTLVTRALPINQNKVETMSHAGSAVAAGIVDMRPADPIEGILISQIAVVNEAALSMYQRAWACLPDYFEAHTKYLQLRQGNPNGCDIDREARPASRPGPATDRRKARHS